ncbi:MAG: dienelactone hydrolase family protein [Nitriliruptorales bacterium]|nr:dienelactone hydrolase family protein [Nitriliruptorales bacterium]
MVKGERVQFPSNGHQSQGYLALPAGGSGPGVIVIQEWWGLVDHIREVCDRLAGQGFVALAPDLYHGETTQEPDEAAKLMMELDIERAAKDMSGAVDHLQGHSAVTTSKLGAVGFCMGGGLVLVLAARNGAKIGAAVSFYGVFKGETPDLSGIECPVLGHFGEEDDSAPPEKVHDLEETIRDQAGEECTFHIYPDAGHAFYNDSRPEAHHPDHAETAWERTLEFLRANLENSPA